MKLATALSERAQLTRKISELNTRLCNNAKTQEGEAPAEQPEALLSELDAAFGRLQTLMTFINLTNSRTVHEGRTLTAMLAEREALAKKLSIMRHFLDESSARVERYSKTEIRIVSTVNVSEMQKTCDTVSKALRQLDETIQMLNWTTELIEAE